MVDNILEQVVREAKDIQEHDYPEGFTWEGFCLVMFPDDSPLEYYNLTREEYDEVLIDAFKRVATNAT